MRLSEHHMQRSLVGVTTKDLVLAAKAEGHPSIRRIEKTIPEIGVEQVSVQILRMLVQCIRNLQLANMPEEDQLEFLVETVREEGGMLTLPQLKLFFRQLALGKLGKLYQRLDSATLGEFLRNYREEVQRLNVAVAEEAERTAKAEAEREHVQRYQNDPEYRESIEASQRRIEAQLKCFTSLDAEPTTGPMRAGQHPARQLHASVDFGTKGWDAGLSAMAVPALEAMLNQAPAEAKEKILQAIRNKTSAD
jgi:hypothetical protein